MGQSDAVAPTSAPDVDLSNYDDEQVKLMEEMCIVLDRDDKPIGAKSKKECKWTSFVSNRSSFCSVRGEVVC